MYNLSQDLKTRPSELCGITSDYVAFCFDQAVSYLGNTIKNRMNEVPMGKGKNAEKNRAHQQEQLVMKLLYGSQSQTQQKFADPAIQLGGGNA